MPEPAPELETVVQVASPFVLAVKTCPEVPFVAGKVNPVPGVPI